MNNGIGRAKALRLGLASLVAVSLMVGPARGWGRLGHRVAGKIAEARLTPNARAAVRDLLEPGESLADVSTWADEVRGQHSGSGPWHYINIPITESRFDPKFNPRGGSVITKIGDFRKILADPNAPRHDRQEALKFLAHFVQDMHQPVHVGHRDDKGGNDLQVNFFEHPTNLHRLWDSGMFDHVKRSESDWVAKLSATITPDLAASWSQGRPEIWANESLDVAREAYLNPPDNAALQKGSRLGQPYLDANLPLAERRLTQAGVRLAWILNEIFP